MGSRWLACCVVVVCGWLGIAVADEPPTRLAGRVTDVFGKPVAGARVYVHARTGERIETVTNGDGRYGTAVPAGGAYTVVIAVEDVHTFRTVLVDEDSTTTLDVEVELDLGGGEVIKIVDKKLPAPAVKPKPRVEERRALPYSQEAVERDAWARAWLLLDVDTRGTVTRLKLLKAPGFDLDRIAIEEGFKLRFEPARDGQGRAIRSYVVWKMEWPAWGWVIQGNGVARLPTDVDQMHAWSKTSPPTGAARDTKGAMGGRAYWAAPLPSAFPHALARVPCAGSGPLNLDARNRAYRDCTGPDLASADARPWITRDTIDTAVADLARKRAAEPDRTGPPPSRVPAIAWTAVTGGLLVTTLVAFERFDTYEQRARDANFRGSFDAGAVSLRNRWSMIRVATGAATLVSGAVTFFLWQRDAARRSFSVQPTEHGQGGIATFGGAF